MTAAQPAHERLEGCEHTVVHPTAFDLHAPAPGDEIIANHNCRGQPDKRSGDHIGKIVIADHDTAEWPPEDDQ